MKLLILRLHYQEPRILSKPWAVDSVQDRPTQRLVDKQPDGCHYPTTLDRGPGRQGSPLQTYWVTGTVGAGGDPKSP